jgi:hypothetical protein
MLPGRGCVTWMTSGWHDARTIVLLVLAPIGVDGGIMLAVVCSRQEAGAWPYCSCDESRTNGL